MIEDYVNDEKAEVRVLIIVDHEMRTAQGGRTFILHEQPVSANEKLLRSITVICGEKDAEDFAKGFSGADIKVIDYDLWKDMKGPVDYFK